MTDSLAPVDLSLLHLTSIPAGHPAFLTRRMDWGDQAEVHRAVMSLFPVALPGPLDARRATSTILYRLENPASGPRILVQSLTEPDRDDHGIARTTLAGLGAVLVAGQQMRFRIDVNAVRSKARSGRRLALQPEEIGRFLHDDSNPERPGLLHGAVTGLEIREVTFDVRRFGQTPLRVAGVTGIAFVADPIILGHKLANGVGRAKSYGCGLLTVAPDSTG
jgi:CRISPR system Cascade subunit CasE